VVGSVAQSHTRDPVTIPMLRGTPSPGLTIGVYYAVAAWLGRRFPGSGSAPRPDQSAHLPGLGPKRRTAAPKSAPVAARPRGGPLRHPLSGSA